MFSYIAKKIFGTKNARVLKDLRPLVARINDLEPSLTDKSDDDLRALTAAYKLRIANGESLDAMLPEAFALCREAGRRVMNMRHFDVQLIGGMVLHRGSIAEMKTGEGKTLVATLPVVLNALSGKGVHLVTVNDYLARRDAEWMGRLYRFLGLTVGVTVHGLNDRERQENYRCDITYGTNSEFGFDYLRDNMKDSIERYVQRPLNFAIVDEVDSILIDEARTPLIISGSAEQSVGLYHQVDAIIPSLRKDIDYTVDEKAHSAILTDSGVDRVENKLGITNLYNPENISWLHHVGKALSAHTLYKRDVNYLVEEGEIIIVDEFTGRKMPGRRWSDGLHQAIEAKEGVEIQEENQTLATISYQNYFRLYNKLAGMTGTADTEAEEFQKIYKLDVVVIPTNRPLVRKDRHDLVYKNEKGKFRAVVDEIERCHKLGQPVLVGTVSVEKSEVVASLLRKKNIAHSVLNAKQHEREAHVVAQAGRRGAVTIATNMAGRGTDIILGGNAEFMARAAVDPEAAGQPGALVDPEKFQEAYAKFKPECDAERAEVLAAGGLQIIGTERHESRRIDNQLRGRAGRQGDPGGSLFFLSLEDDLMRIFGAERITNLMERLGMEEDVPIEAGLINRAIENAQKKVEGHHFDSRKNLLEYDDVMNQQRKTIYALRRQVLEGCYQPTLSESEIKAGKVATTATTSGPHTIESMVKEIRPILGRMAEAMSKEKVPPPADAPPDTPPQVLQVPLDPEIFRSGLYRQFGTYVDVTGITEDRTATLDKLAEKVSGMLIQQRERILDTSEEVLQELVTATCSSGSHAEDWNLDALRAGMKERFGFEPTISTKGIMEVDGLATKLWEEVEKIIEAREQEFGLPFFLYFGRHFMLEEIDQGWIEHLRNMEALREGIYLRGYAQKDPKQEYKIEGFAIFGELMSNISRNVCEKLFHIQIKREETEATQQQMAAAEARPKKKRMVESGGGVADKSDGARAEEGDHQPVRRSEPKVGRNDPCPCGSGKKYKKCHGA